MTTISDDGIPCYYGHWLIAGNPRVILIDYRALFRDLDTNKYLMWADHGISTNSSDIAFAHDCSYCVAMPCSSRK